MPSAGLKPTIPAIKQLQTCALDHMTSGISKADMLLYDYYINAFAKHSH
jgi:hypothetical protein